eukprot:symbB.v1.2.036570.t1/scaffold5149.1/size30368/1
MPGATIHVARIVELTQKTDTTIEHGQRGFNVTRKQLLYVSDAATERNHCSLTCVLSTRRYATMEWLWRLKTCPV